MDEIKVKLGDKEHLVTLPMSFTVRHEVLAAGNKNLRRATCAALGLSLRLGLKARYAYDPLAYGGDVLDELVARGLRPSEVFAAAVRCFNAFSDTTLTEDEVKAAEKNSGGADPAP